ncbi:rho GTPase-activating protein 20-like [Lemur catta]|uniref:rho GTPase-activating protein 20-like n=1 Tax=Lemur catta TaxID=9447 RepID=UPI001E266807|nr:rho GTPase-activating protein 20-like [Lemur catta]
MSRMAGGTRIWEVRPLSWARALRRRGPHARHSHALEAKDVGFKVTAPGGSVAHSPALVCGGATVSRVAPVLLQLPGVLPTESLDCSLSSGKRPCSLPADFHQPRDPQPSSSLPGGAWAGAGNLIHPCAQPSDPRGGLGATAPWQGQLRSPQGRQRPALMQKMKALLERRRSVQPLLPDRALQEQASASTERPSAGTNTCAFLSSFVCSDRTLLIDGLVELRSRLRRQERHLFLFNDLLVVAKRKNNNNFKMKNKIKLTDMWPASCVDEVGDGKSSAMKSFVLGWPTENFVATFSSLEQKDTWLSLLQRHINLEKQKDHLKSIPLRIFIEDMGNCVHGSGRDYQLCISYGKEEAPYLLIGHEYPYGIKMKHLRDTALLTADSKDSTAIFNSEETFLMEELPRERQCRFILKPRFLAAARPLRESKAPGSAAGVSMVISVEVSS